MCAMIFAGANPVIVGGPRGVRRIVRPKTDPFRGVGACPLEILKNVFQEF